MWGSCWIVLRRVRWHGRSTLTLDLVHPMIDIADFSERPFAHSLEQIFAELDDAGAADMAIERDVSPSPKRESLWGTQAPPS